MKTMTMIATLLCSALAAAYPAVNDISNLVGTYTYQGQAYPLTMKMEIVGFDGANYNVQQTTTIMGQNNVQNTSTAAKDMITPQTMVYVLSNCAVVSGTSETITVPAGTYNTCKIIKDEADATRVSWVGDVPFQLVKMTVVSKTDGSQIAAELQSFKNGQ